MVFGEFALVFDQAFAMTRFLENEKKIEIKKDCSNASFAFLYVFLENFRDAEILCLLLLQARNPFLKNYSKPNISVG